MNKERAKRLLRMFAEEIEESLDFVDRHLSHSPLVVRVEPMLPMNAGREHPELRFVRDEARVR